MSKDRKNGVLLSSVTNPSGFVSMGSRTTLPQNYSNPLLRAVAAPAAGTAGAGAGGGGGVAVNPTPSQPPRPAKFSEIDLLDSSITGSTDLAGGKKARIEHMRVPDGSVLETKYIMGRKLGQGSFGTVRLGEDRTTGITWAVKSVKKTKGSTDKLEQLAREVAIMKRVKHPHIVQLKEVHETPSKIYLVMEYCKGGELVRRVAQKRYCSEHDCRIIMTRLLDAVAYLHDHGVVHRDLKPENVLLSTADPDDQLNIKVSDFGLATFSGACKMMESQCGTPFYMAPEILANLGYSHQCDIWSLGVMLYLLLCGYRRECEHALQKMIANRKIEYEEPMTEDVSPAAKDLLTRMLQFDPAERITAREALQHPWTNGKEEAPENLGQTTVLQMMKSYNAERRLKRLFNVVLATVRFNRGGVFGGTNDDDPSDDEHTDEETASEGSGRARSSPPLLPKLQLPDVTLESDDEIDRLTNDQNLAALSEATSTHSASSNSTTPLVVAPTNTNRPKRPTTASRNRLDGRKDGKPATGVTKARSYGGVQSTANHTTSTTLKPTTSPTGSAENIAAAADAKKSSGGRGSTGNLAAELANTTISPSNVPPATTASSSPTTFRSRRNSNPTPTAAVAASGGGAGGSFKRKISVAGMNPKDPAPTLRRKPIVANGAAVGGSGTSSAAAGSQNKSGVVLTTGGVTTGAHAVPRKLAPGPAHPTTSTNSRWRAEGLAEPPPVLVRRSSKHND